MAQTDKKKILIADSSSITIREIFKSDSAKLYDIQTVDSGEECLAKIESFKPELVFIELLLPKIHGIEILKKLKTDKNHRNIGVVITSSLSMIQNYNAALELGADYFLTKPFDSSQFFLILERYFQGSLTPDPFKNKESQFSEAVCYNPIATTSTSYLKFWGTRGSSPVSGQDFIRYGGNTCCLEVRNSDKLLVIDAGTGIRELGETIDTNVHTNIPLIIGHTHWDHITGFPFFAPLYHKQCTLDIYSPVGYQKETEELFNDMLAFGYFPVRLEDMFANLTFNKLRDGGAIEFGNLKIECHHSNHPGPTLCFKITSPRKTVGYVTDNELLLGYHGPPGSIGKESPLLEPHLSLLAFLDDCHVLVHEAQYFPYEYHDKVGWGHSSISNAVAFIKQLNHCREWIVTHHDPTHTDKDLMLKAQLHADVINECNLNVTFRMAYDGMILPL